MTEVKWMKVTGDEDNEGTGIKMTWDGELVFKISLPMRGKVNGEKHFVPTLDVCSLSPIILI